MTMRDSERKAEAPPLFVRLLLRFQRRLGYFVADHHFFVLFATLAFTAVTSIKIAFTPQQDDIKTGYTPVGSRSIDEMVAYNDFFAHTADPVGIFIFTTAKDGGSMHRPEYMSEAVRLLDFTSHNITHKGRAFDDFCTDFCLINEPIRLFNNGLALAKDFSNTGRVNLSFPMMEILGNRLDLSPNFFGVEKLENGTITYVKIVAAQLRADVPNGWTPEDVKHYERTVSHFLHNQESRLVAAYGLSLTYTVDEIVRTGMSIFPFIAIGFLIMAAFSVVTVIGSSLYMRQRWQDRVSMAILGCVCPLLATSTALGLLFWFGFRFGSILCVTPFLILAIGVDDSYLTIQSWMRLQDEGLSHRERVAEMCVDIGPSVTITSMTNCLAFMVGIYTPTPEIQLFCMGNSVAVFIDYVYQLTMFIAMVSIAGEREMAANSNVKHGSKVSPATPSGTLQIDISSHANNKEGIDLSLLLEAYSEWVSNGFTALLVVAALFAYWCVAVNGARSIQILLSPDKLVLADSKLIEMNHLREQYISPEYSSLNIFVNNPGDLENGTQRARVLAAIEAFEALPECLGPQFSHFWLRDYEAFIQAGGGEEDEEDDGQTQKNTTQRAETHPLYDEDHLMPFLQWPEFHHLNAFVKFHPNGTVSRFFAMVAYHGAELSKFESRRDLLRRWRETADAFLDIGVVMFDDNSQFADQIDAMVPATLSTSLCTLVCMMIVCFLFMYNFFTMVVASISIASICLGVFGFLAYWGIDLDPISMATTIFSIGFSVDFPAHITYHYYREGLEDTEATPSRRVARSLVAIAYPLIQCGISTILFVCCLLFVKTYMSEVFVKTMVLVVTIGFVHGLVVVPVLLCSLSNIYTVFIDDSPDNKSVSSFTRLLRWGGLTPSGSDSKVSR